MACRYVRNITDAGHFEEEGREAEDKISKKAVVEKLEPMELVQKYTNLYHWAMKQLNNIEPSTIIKSIPLKDSNISKFDVDLKTMTRNDLVELSIRTESQMNKFAEDLEFEKAIEQRENLLRINQTLLKI